MKKFSVFTLLFLFSFLYKASALSLLNTTKGWSCVYLSIDCPTEQKSETKKPVAEQTTDNSTSEVDKVKKEKVEINSTATNIPTTAKQINTDIAGTVAAEGNGNLEKILTEYAKKNPEDIKNIPKTESASQSNGNSSPGGGSGSGQTSGCIGAGGGGGNITGSTQGVKPWLLECTKKAAGIAGATANIISGYRTQGQQDAICAGGGTGAKACGPNGSRHSQGEAVDVKVSAMGPEKGEKFMLGMLTCGLSTGFYAGDGHIHFGMDGGPTIWRQFGAEPPVYAKKALLRAKIGVEKIKPRSKVKADATAALGCGNEPKSNSGQAADLPSV
jgi:hypothetical protein